MLIPMIGIVACGGEEISEGTVTRVATRIVTEELKPTQTMVICLPLYISGKEDERAFVRKQPTIIVDGCDKGCAEKVIKMNGGNVAAVIRVSDVMRAYGLKSNSRRKLDEEGEKLARKVAEKIAEEVDRIIGEMTKQTAMKLNI
ncbi:MAG: putative zinc-binding protein [Candidatus Jordarchaeales archaeon]